MTVKSILQCPHGGLHLSFMNHVSCTGWILFLKCFCMLRHFKRYFYLQQNKTGKGLTCLFVFCLFLKHFCAMESFTSTYKKFLFPWSSATSISWNHQLPSPFTEVLNKSHGNLSSKCFLQVLNKAPAYSFLSNQVFSPIVL